MRRSLYVLFVVALCVNTASAQWQPVELPPAGTVHHLTSSLNGYLFARIDRSTYRLRLGGESWQPVNHYPTHLPDNGVLYSVEDAHVYRSDDDGNSWSLVYTIDPSVEVFEIGLDGNFYYASSGGEIFASSDAGLTWELIPASGGQVAAIAVASDGRLFLGGSGGVEAGVVSYTNGGRGAFEWEWNAFGCGGPGVNAITELAVARPAHIYIIARCNGSVYSGDNGMTWTNRPSLGSLDEFEFGPDGWLYDWDDQSNVRKSSDGGRTWTQVLPAPPGIIDVVSIDADGSFYAATTESLYHYPVPSAPAPIFPQSDQIGLPTRITLSWSWSGAHRYDIQIAADRQFESIVYHENTPNELAEFVAPVPDHEYYWRVRWVGQTGPGNWSEVRRFSVRTSGSPNVELSVPQHGSHDVSTEPYFVWSEVAGSETYVLQVSKHQDFTPNVVDVAGIRGTAYQVRGLESGTLYYWRVGAVNVLGETMFTRASPFRTETQRTAPSVPELLSPVDGMNALPTSSLLRWQQSPGANRYEVQVAFDPDFKSLSGSANTPRLDEAFVAPLVSTSYYWRVRGLRDGLATDWSETRVFTTGTEGPLVAGNLAPANSATGVSTEVILRWAGASSAQFHRLQVSGSVDFGSVIAEEDSLFQNSPSPIGLNAGQEYYWRVAGVDSLGRSTFGPVHSFTTAARDPELDAHNYLKNGDFEKDGCPEHCGDSWHDDWRVVEVRGNFTFPQVWVPPARATRSQCPTDYPYTDHQLEMQIQSQYGMKSEAYVENSVWVPQGGAELSMLVWGGHDPATVIVSIIDQNGSELVLDSFSPVIVEAYTGPGGYFQCSGNEPETRAYDVTSYGGQLVTVRLRANTSASHGNNTVVWFDDVELVSTKTVGTVTLILPKDGAAGISSVPALSWEAVPGASTYHLQIDTDSAFGSPIIDDSTISPSTVTLSDPLPYSTEHFWRVRAGMDDGLGKTAGTILGPWSETRSFTVAVGTGTENESGLPTEFALHPAYPNPLNSSTTLSFDLPEAETVRLTVFDVLGRPLESLVNGRRSAGKYEVIWDAEGVPSGSYFIRLEAGPFVQTKQAVLVR